VAESRMVARLDELARALTTQETERNALMRRLIGAQEPAPSTRGPRGSSPEAAPAPACAPRGRAPASSAKRATSSRDPYQDITAAMHRHLRDVRCGLDAGVSERLGIAKTRPPESPTGASQEEISPAREAARHHLEDIQATLARLQCYFESAPPSALPRSVQAGATDGRPESAVSREAHQVSGEAHSREARRRNKPHQAQVAASELESNAERLRRTIANSGGLSDYLAQREMMVAEIRAQVDARGALRRHDEQQPAGLGVYESQREPPRPGWAEAPGRELTPQQEQALRDELRNQWENRQRTGFVSRPPLKAVPKSQRPGVKDETLVRDVMERDPGAVPPVPNRSPSTRKTRSSKKGRGG
jgi:hypothetical protein